MSDCEGIPFCGVIPRSMQQTTQPLPSFSFDLRQAIAAVANADTKRTPNKPRTIINHPNHLHSRLKDTCGPESRFVWFGVIRPSRIAPARRRKATVKTGRKPTVTGTHNFPGSTYILDSTTLPY